MKRVPRKYFFKCRYIVVVPWLSDSSIEPVSATSQATTTSSIDNEVALTPLKESKKNIVKTGSCQRFYRFTSNRHISNRYQKKDFKTEKLIDIPVDLVHENPACLPYFYLPYLKLYTYYVLIEWD